MPLLSCFTPCGFLELTSEPSCGEQIYDAMIANLGGNYDVEQGTHVEASVYARAMAFGELRYLLEHAGAQIDPWQLSECLAYREGEYGIIPTPGETLEERRAAVAAAMVLPLGARKSAVDEALSRLLGSAFVGLRNTAPSEIVNYPTDLGDQPMNLQLPTVPRKLVRLTNGVSTDLGVPQAVAYTAVDPSDAVILVGDVLTIEPEIDGQTEVVHCSSPPVVPGTFVATFTKGHEPGCYATTQPYPYWTGTQRASLVFLTDAAGIDPVLRARAHALLARIMRGVSTWGLVQGTGGTAGPFTLDASYLDATPFSAVTL
jgi:hypothetical protein